MFRRADTATLRDGSDDPARVETLIGREALLESIESVLRTSRRVVTLVGPAGIGKTAVAKALLARESRRLRDPPRTVFADLREARDAEGISRVLADALDVRRTAGAVDVQWTAQTARATASRRVALFAIDNAEPVVDAVAAVVSELRRRAPDCTWVVGSRETLRVADEVVIEFVPLALPHPGADPRTAEAQTLCERAAAMHRAARDAHCACTAAIHLADVCRELGQLTRARSLYEAALESVGGRANDWSRAWRSLGLAWTCMTLGDTGPALEHCAAAADFARRQGLLRLEANALVGSGVAAIIAGDGDRTHVDLTRAADMTRAGEVPDIEGLARGYRGVAAMRAGSSAEAEHDLSEAVTLLRAADDAPNAALFESIRLSAPWAEGASSHRLERIDEFVRSARSHRLPGFAQAIGILRSLLLAARPASGQARKSPMRLEFDRTSVRDAVVANLAMDGDPPMTVQDVSADVRVVLNHVSRVLDA